MSSDRLEIDVITLCKEAGMCFADCHFLDLDPYENLLSQLAEMADESERSSHLELVREDDRRRRRRYHQLERFAAAVLRSAAQRLEQQCQGWHEQDFSAWVGAQKVLSRLELEALLLESHNEDIVEVR